MKIEKIERHIGNNKDTVTHVYETMGEEIQVEVRYCPSKQMTKLEKKYTPRIQGRSRNHEVKPDWGKVQDDVIRGNLETIKGLKLRSLRGLLEPDVKMTLEPGDSWDDGVTFTDELKETIVESGSLDFKNFVFMAVRDVESFGLRDIEEEIANLPAGSGINKAETSKRQSK